MSILSHAVEPSLQRTSREGPMLLARTRSPHRHTPQKRPMSPRPPARSRSPVVLPPHHQQSLTFPQTLKDERLSRQGLLATLPAELLQQIASYLPLPSTVAFSLTSRRLCYALGQGSWVKLDKADKHEKIAFLNLLQRDARGFWLCHRCLVLHRRRRRTQRVFDFIPSLTPKNWPDVLKAPHRTGHTPFPSERRHTSASGVTEGFPFCDSVYCDVMELIPDVMSRVALEPGFLETFQSEPMAMFGKDVSGAACSCHHGSLPTAELKYQLEFRVVGERLLMATSHHLEFAHSSSLKLSREMVDRAASQIHLDICPHVSLNSLLATLEDPVELVRFCHHLAGRERGKARFCMKCSKPKKSCDYCPTEWYVSLHGKRHRQGACHYVKVNVWHDLGSGRPEDEWQWRSVLGWTTIGDRHSSGMESVRKAFESSPR